MALDKEKEIGNTDVKINYWVIESAKISFLDSFTQVCLKGYKNKGSFTAGKEAFIQDKIMLSGIFNTINRIESELANHGYIIN